jgi:glutathione S-transferase
VLLYDSAVSGNCYKVRLLLAQLGLPYERRDVDVVDRSGRLDLLGELNPGLRVPTLVLDDGRPLGESGAILMYLGEGTPYVPEDQYLRAQVLQWLFFEQYSHEPYIAVVRFWLTLAASRPPDDEVEARREGGRAALAAMERHLATRAFLVGEVYSVADIALYAYTHVAHEGGFDLTPYSAVRGWLGRVASQPGHVPITA